MLVILACSTGGDNDRCSLVANPEIPRLTTAVGGEESEELLGGAHKRNVTAARQFVPVLDSDLFFFFFF